MIERLAPAKINLVLEVLGKRDDGYHEISSLMQTVNLCDIITFELAEKLSFDCIAPGLKNSDNLVVKAAELLKEAYGCRNGAKIALEKRISWGVGFGGGSSDAATTLLALSEIWELGCETSVLVSLAAELGSDVPVFIHKGTVLAEGRGDRVTPLPAAGGWYVVLVPPLPKIPYKTKQLYTLLNERHYTQGQFVTKAVEAISSQGKVSPSLLYNVFDGVAFDAFHGLDDWWGRFEDAGATNIHLAGSGPALFAPVETEAKAEDIGRLLRQQGLEACAVSTFMHL
jgi:4-diphosphocytidyl-2-C-methyl-D-erythritol kinase